MSTADSFSTNGAPADAPDAEYGKPDYVKSEYVSDNSTAYNGNRNTFSYPSNPASLAEPPQISPEITSTSQPNGMERAPSRQGNAQWAPPTYPTSQQRTAVYNVVSDTRGPTNGVTDPYGTPPSNTSYPPVKGSSKRDRDDDEEQSHTETQRDAYEFKRRKTISDSSVNGVVGASVGLQSVTTGAVPRRR